MRILMVVFNQTGKGTYWRALVFSQALAGRGHDVTLMSMSPNAKVRLRSYQKGSLRCVESPDLLSGPLRSGWDPWDTLTRLNWLHGQKFDLVHAVESRPVVLAPALAAQRGGAALVMEWCDWFGRGGSVEERPNPWVRAILRPVETYFEEHFRTRPDGTITINGFLRDRAVALGVNPATVTVIRQGCDPNIRSASRVASREALGLPLDALLVGYVGAIFSRDAALMAAAFNQVGRALPGTRLILAGYFNRAIEPLLDDPTAVIRTGTLPSLSQVHAYLSACDLCWLPLADTGANRGRWPSKLNDYMALGRPVVATAVSDLAEVVPGYGIGLVTPDNADEFASATVTLLRDPGRAAAMGQAARAAAEGDFSWQHRVDELEDFYQHVLARKADAHLDERLNTERAAGGNGRL